MQPIPTRIDPLAAQFLSNREQNLAAIGTLQQHLQRARRGGGERYAQRQRDRNKLLPWERVELLLDRGSPFLEICPLAGLHEGGVVPGGSMIAGIGWIQGRLCAITASDSTVNGGAITAWGLKRGARLDQIAHENRLPMVHCIESAGADLPNQADIFVPGGRSFRDITRRSREGIPTISLVFGSCTAGGAYIPGMSDYSVMVDQAAYLYLAGPPLVKMAIGEDIDDEALGGAAMHTSVSGVSDYLAADEVDAIRIGRELVAGLMPAQPQRPRGPALPPRAPAEELLGIASADLKQPFDCREVLARVVDDSRFHAFKPRYGSTLVTGWAEIGGYRVGILGNNGILFTESANKGAQFIQLCAQNATPILFLQNITGFMVGEAVERAGIIKAGAKLVNAVANAGVPMITLMIGSSYGAGNYAMAGRAFDPRFVFSWPNHKIAVMGGEQLAGVLDLVKRAAAARRNKPVNEEQLAMLKKMLSGKVEHESTCWSATGRLWDDGVIDPRDTRAVLISALCAVHNHPVARNASWGTVRH